RPPPRSRGGSARGRPDGPRPRSPPRRPRSEEGGGACASFGLLRSGGSAPARPARGFATRARRAGEYPVDVPVGRALQPVVERPEERGCALALPPLRQERAREIGVLEGEGPELVDELEAQGVALLLA